jgi:hypothetical protein
VLLSVGCPEPADLDNPGAYPKPGGNAASGSANGGTPGGGTPNGGNATGGMAAGGGTTGGMTAGGMATGGSGNPASCETACMKDVLEGGCTLCHGANLKSAMLDLEAAGYTGRLKDQPPTHAEAGGTCPTGDKLIDSANPMSSWLLKKVSGGQGSCGTNMPPGTGLAGEDLKCVQDYVSCVAAGGM